MKVLQIFLNLGLDQIDGGDLFDVSSMDKGFYYSLNCNFFNLYFSCTFQVYIKNK